MSHADIGKLYLQVRDCQPEIILKAAALCDGLLVLDSQWWAQEKFDGKRVLVLKSGGTITGINRSGLVIALPTPVVEHARRLSVGHCLLDGEAIGDTFIAFDLLEYDGHDLRGEPYNHRLKTLYPRSAPGSWTRGGRSRLNTCRNAWKWCDDDTCKVAGTRSRMHQYNASM